MAIFIEQRAQLLQTLGSIGSSAEDAATEGIDQAVKTDPQTMETALKLFGGFDRNEFENINGKSPNFLLPMVRPPASYERPAEYFKPLSNTMIDQPLLSPVSDLLQQLQDSRLRMADGLSRFSDNNMTKTLTRQGLVITDGKAGEVSQGGLDALDAFNKLFAMENTIQKQVQLHRELDFSAGQFSDPGQNPRLDRGLKGIPDMQAAAPQSTEMLTALERALTGLPETVGEAVQRLETIDSKLLELGYKIAEPEFLTICLRFHEHIVDCKQIFQNLPQDSRPTHEVSSAFQKIRDRMNALLQYIKMQPSDL